MWIRIKYFTYNCFPESSFLVKKGQNRYSKKITFLTDEQTDRHLKLNKRVKID